MLTFDFSFVGESEGKISDLSIIQEIEDLKSAIEFFLGLGIKKLHIIGSSMGGVVTLLLKWNPDYKISTRTLIATPIDLIKLLIINTGITNVDALPDGSMTEVEGVKIKNGFFKEVNKLDINNAITTVRIPTLVIHGGKDKVVDVSDAVSLDRKLNTIKKLVIMPDGDHNLTGESDIALMKKEIITWMKLF